MRCSHGWVDAAKLCNQCRSDVKKQGLLDSPLQYSTSMNMNMNDTASLSRATSISRASKQGSTISRSQSLIKKNIAPHDLRPSDVLIERFIAWKAIVKQLIAYFEVRLVHLCRRILLNLYHHIYGLGYCRYRE